MMGLSRGTLIVVMICLTPVICQGIEEKNYRKISGIGELPRVSGEDP